jgi:hypothetical protein
VEWHRCSPHATDCAFRYIHLYRTSMLHAGCKRSHTELLRCVPGNSPTGNRIKGMHAAGQVAGCGAQLRSTARLPSQFRQSLPAARVVTYKTEASVPVSPQSVGMEHLSHHLTPARVRASPLAPNRHVPCPTQRTHAIGLWMAKWCPLSEGSSKFGRSGPCYPRALCSSQWLRHVPNEKQRAARDVARKTEAMHGAYVFPGARFGRHVSRLYVPVALQPALQHLHRMQPSCAVFHPVGAAHRALCGAQQPDCVRCSQRKIHSKSWEKVTSPKKL